MLQQLLPKNPEEGIWGEGNIWWQNGKLSIFHTSKNRSFWVAEGSSREKDSSFVFTLTKGIVSHIYTSSLFFCCNRYLLSLALNPTCSWVDKYRSFWIHFTVTDLKKNEFPQNLLGTSVLASPKPATVEKSMYASFQQVWISGLWIKQASCSCRCSLLKVAL